MEKQYKVVSNADILYIKNNNLTKSINDIDPDEAKLINFLFENQEKEIIVKEIKWNQAKICRFEGKKTFWVDLYYLEEITSINDENDMKNEIIEDEEEWEEIELIENENTELSKKDIIVFYIKKYWYILVIVLVVLFCIYKFNYDHKQEEIQKAKQELLKQTEQIKMADDISNLILEKAKEFDYQKEMRDKKRDLINSYDEKINNSINRVKNFDIKIAEIEKQQIEKAQ